MSSVSARPVSFAHSGAKSFARQFGTPAFTLSTLLACRVSNLLVDGWGGGGTSIPFLLFVFFSACDSHSKQFSRLVCSHYTLLLPFFFVSFLFYYYYISRRYLKTKHAFPLIIITTLHTHRETHHMGIGK